MVKNPPVAEEKATHPTVSHEKNVRLVTCSPFSVFPSAAGGLLPASTVVDFLSVVMQLPKYSKLYVLLHALSYFYPSQLALIKPFQTLDQLFGR